MLFVSGCGGFCARKHTKADAKDWGEECGFPNRLLSMAKPGAFLSKS